MPTMVISSMCLLATLPLQTSAMVLSWPPRVSRSNSNRSSRTTSRGISRIPAIHSMLSSSSSSSSPSPSSLASYSLGLGEYYVELERPLGMILEERDNGGGGGGVMVKEIMKNGDHDNANGGSFSAWKSGVVAPGDVLQRINDVDVSQSDFEQVMDLLVAKDEGSNDNDSNGALKLVFSDGLGQLDMPKNVLQQLKTSDDAFLIDAVVRQAVREIRRDGRLGDLRHVEVVVGAGVQQQDGRTDLGARKLGLARFFAIFSTDNVTTYSCNCAAKGIKIEDTTADNDDENDDNDDGRPIQVRIASLSCAKDEGLGRTYDLIQEDE
eukprot:CAMPEP_0113505062 /NCGR_PEP_ID=MMETSP0014_2-20120614/35092_1 /TAXON_ID=2857 /ORGANISM="Nitzschia sp." /LENGTH=322 /DNA_ID=CAMNT_0000400301 /DNA_START=11 /DNA_END=979 /DNA_ORIENTATION=- /assembly_acc=CAM_ASM_000159